MNINEINSEIDTNWMKRFKLRQALIENEEIIAALVNKKGYKWGRGAASVFTLRQVNKVIEAQIVRINERIVILKIQKESIQKVE